VRIQLLSFIAVIQVKPHSGRKAGFLDLVGKSRSVAGPDAVVQCEVSSLGVQAMCHAEQWRDADATREEERPAGLPKSEVIPRFADGERIPYVYVVVHRHRTASRSRIAKHTNSIAVSFGVWIAQ
jgi:hypothetical protein